MQGRVDLAGGKHLFLSKEESLVDLFGDPCPGRDKCLMLHYEILGTEGKVDGLESDGRLLTPISISCTYEMSCGAENIGVHVSLLPSVTMSPPQGTCSGGNLHDLHDLHDCACSRAIGGKS